MIIKLSKQHIPAVAELERTCFSEPWSDGSLELLTREGGVGYVCLDGEQVVAYGGMMHVLDEGQITNIATLPDYRRQGHAAAILSALCGFAGETGLSELTLEVRRSNDGAIALYQCFGFETVGERKGFYRHPTEDALIMKKTIIGED